MSAMNDKNKNKILPGVISLLVVGVVILVALFVVPKIEAKLFPQKPGVSTRRGEALTPDNTDVYIGGEWYRQKADLSTVLVIGVDNTEGLIKSNAYNNEGQADFLMLLARDNTTGKGFMIHINRDTITNIPTLSVSGKKLGRTNAQLALAFNYGDGRESSCENTKEAVQYLLYGVDVDHYFAMSMDGVAILNDGVGGVEVEVLDSFADVDPTLEKGKTILLEGEHALNYVRARGGMEDKTNLNRMERQRQYVNAWLAKANTLSESKISEMAISVSGEAISDCTLQELKTLSNDMLQTEFAETYTIPGEAKQGKEFIEYHIDEPKMQSLILDLFYDKVTDEHAK